MKYKKTLTIIILLLAVMLFSVGMIVKEADERQQDISDFEKLEDLITEPEQQSITDTDIELVCTFALHPLTQNAPPNFQRGCIVSKLESFAKR